MKALSIMQPWAWLIVNGHKSVENRTWNTNYRGQLLIHAGRKQDAAGYDFIQDEFPQIKLPTVWEMSHLIGGVVGICTLEHVVQDRKSTRLNSSHRP